MIVVPVEEVRFSPADLVILCGEPGAMRPIIERASEARACIDASGASRRWDSVPWVHTGIPGADAVPGGGLLAAPQPVSATVAQILAPLSRDGLVSSAAVTVLLPASALGAKGADVPSLRVRSKGGDRASRTHLSSPSRDLAGGRAKF